MRVAAVLGFVVLAVCAAGCPRGGKPAVTTCTAADGSTLQVGDQAPTADGCNICVCQPDFTLACTERACNDAGPAEPDAGPVVDAGFADAGTADGGVDEGPCHDEDGDGFYTCVDPNHPERPTAIDCDDTRFHVQPGGIEFPDTPEDDNCDGHNDDFTTCPCGGSASNALDLGAGLDLCGDVVASATKNGAAIQFGEFDKYRGVIDARVRVRQDDPNAPPIIIGNSCMTSLSSGDATGTATDVQAAGDGDCPPSAFQDPDPDRADPNPTICDLAQVHFHIHTPPNASGFAFDFMFMSQEWPEYLCQIYNDTFYAIVDGDSAVNGGAPTNTAFDSANRPITVNVGFFEDPADWSVSLDGTPYGQSDGASCPVCDPTDPFGGCAAGCQLPSYCSDPNLPGKTGSGSGWLTTTVPVTPGQDFTLTMSIHDEGDQIFDSLVLLDNFRWLPFAPTLQTAKGP